ncbi:MAG: YceI family protein [Ginsengibacter sp.]|jgi:polyisoprenoid-binding protein YceI
MKTNKNKLSFHFSLKALLSFGVLLLAFGLQTTKAQTTLKTTVGQITVNGTSNVHDWDMTTTAASVISVCVISNGELHSMKSLDFIMMVKNLKSKHSIMDSRAYKTMNADKFDKITFKLTTASAVTSTVKGKYIIKAEGNLTISGFTKPVSMLVNGVLMADGSLELTGSTKIKMSEFKIDPPSFMLGAMKVYDDLTISFDLKLK